MLQSLNVIQYFHIFRGLILSRELISSEFDRQTDLVVSICEIDKI